MVFSYLHIPVQNGRFCLYWRINGSEETRNTFKEDEKCYLFHLKSSFHYDEVQIFVLIFLGYEGKQFDRKERLVSKIMTSQPVKQIITMHILPSISRTVSKWNRVN